MTSKNCFLCNENDKADSARLFRQIHLPGSNVLRSFHGLNETSQGFNLFCHLLSISSKEQDNLRRIYSNGNSLLWTCEKCSSGFDLLWNLIGICHKVKLDIGNCIARITANPLFQLLLKSKDFSEIEWTFLSRDSLAPKDLYHLVDFVPGGLVIKVETETLDLDGPEPQNFEDFEPETVDLEEPQNFEDLETDEPEKFDPNPNLSVDDDDNPTGVVASNRTRSGRLSKLIKRYKKRSSPSPPSPKSQSHKRKVEVENSDSDSDSEPKIKIVSNKRVHLIYTPFRTFSSKNESAAFVKESKMWTMNRTTENASDIRKYYNCKVKVTCPVRMYLSHDKKSQNVTMFRTDGTHDHPEKVVGIPQDVKNVILKLYEKGITKPNGILNALAKDGHKEPKKSQLASYLNTIRANKH